MLLCRDAYPRCPYFYYVEKSFVVVFVAAGVRSSRATDSSANHDFREDDDGRAPVVRAVISRSTHALRRQLELAQIPFTAPFFSRRDGDSDGMGDGESHPAAPCSPALSREGSALGTPEKTEGERQSELEEELRQYENAASVSIYSTQARAFAHAVPPGDGGPTSLLRFDGRWAVRGFAEVLLNRVVQRNIAHGNVRAVWNMGDLRTFDVPTLLAPVSAPFLSASLQRPRISHHLRHRQRLHLHFDGIFLPTSAKQFVDNMQRAFDIGTVKSSCSCDGHTSLFSSVLAGVSGIR